MGDLLKKASEYKIFNYVSPGVVFTVIASELDTYDSTQIGTLLGTFSTIFCCWTSYKSCWPFSARAILKKARPHTLMLAIYAIIM